MAQVQQLPDIRDRYNGWTGTISQAIVAPNFTESGFHVTTAPNHIVDLLKKSITKNLENATTEELYAHVDGNSPQWESPLLLYQEHLSRYILEELRPLLEEWAGIKLIGEIAYGPRIYRNESILHMHGKYIIRERAVYISANLLFCKWTNFVCNRMSFVVDLQSTSSIHT